jgi:hypothetical protein
MFFRLGPGSSGYNFQPEFLDWDAHMTIPASGTLATGQCLARDCTLFPSTAGADGCVLPTNASAGPIMGVYQGPAIVNPSSTATLGVDVVLRQHGYGVALAAAVTAGTAVTVGGLLNMQAANNSAIQAATLLGVLSTYVGIALATGSVTAKGSTLITVPGSGQTNLLVNCYINCN